MLTENVPIFLHEMKLLAQVIIDYCLLCDVYNPSRRIFLDPK